LERVACTDKFQDASVALATLQKEISSAKDPGSVGLFLLRRLNVTHAAHRSLVDQLYSWIIGQRILTPKEVEDRDLLLFLEPQRYIKRRDEVTRTLKRDFASR
jgi:hypothetical protein